jgi:pimeloyl-ACP methyl ester carboxylesterase
MGRWRLEGRFRRQRRSESDHIAGGRRRRNQSDLDEQEGPAVLVGHSYGGVVITKAGMHPKSQPSSTSPPLLRTRRVRQNHRRPSAILYAAEGGISLPRRRRWRPRSALIWIQDRSIPGRQPGTVWLGCERRRGQKPSWYLVARDDKMIMPPAQRQMSTRAGSTVVEVPGSHAVYVSNPRAVVALIEQAADASSRLP